MAVYPDGGPVRPAGPAGQSVPGLGLLGPETAVSERPSTWWEYVFVRAAPFLFLGSLVGIVLTGKRDSWNHSVKGRRVSGGPGFYTR